MLSPTPDTYLKKIISLIKKDIINPYLKTHEMNYNKLEYIIGNVALDAVHDKGGNIYKEIMKFVTDENERVRKERLKEVLEYVKDYGMCDEIRKISHT